MKRVVFFFLVGVGACIGSEATDATAPPVSADGGSPDSGATGADGGTTSDAGEDAAVDAGPTFNALADSTKWSFFDIRSAQNFGATANVFDGASFDGRYINYAPGSGTDVGATTLAMRYDTQGAFGQKTSWTSFDLSSILEPSEAAGFVRSVSDGKHVYLANFAPRQLALDVSGDYADAGAWKVFDLATHVSPTATQFLGETFDGRWVYYAPYAYGVTVRYDTQLRFDDADSWQSYDMTAVRSNARFAAAGFDGHYVYYAALDDTSDAPSGVVARFDTTQNDFGTSWVFYDLAANLPTAPTAFHGAVFDGRYLYLVPYHGKTLVTRYDTTQAFTSPSSWVTFDMTTIAGASGTPGWAGGNFDGKYIYFVPYGPTQANLSGVVVRYDTTGAGFGSVGAWEAFDIATLEANAVGYQGCAFDGENLYLVPYGSGLAARFSARSPAKADPRAASTF